MNFYAGAGGVAVFFAKGVLEDALEVFCGGVVGVDGQVAVETEAERAQVVESEDVVCVTVGVEDCVNVADVFADGLCVEVGPGIDQDGAAVVVEANRGAGATVARVAVGRCGGGADGAVAAEGRHPHGGAGTEKGEGRLHHLADDAGAAGAGPSGATGRFGGCGTGERLGDFEEGHA